MRKTILVLLALLLATGAYAQIGSPPGISSAPPQLVGATLTNPTFTGSSFDADPLYTTASITSGASFYLGVCQAGKWNVTAPTICTKDWLNQSETTNGRVNSYLVFESGGAAKLGNAYHWSPTDSIDNDGDGNTDEADERASEFQLSMGRRSSTMYQYSQQGTAYGSIVLDPAGSGGVVTGISVDVGTAAASITGRTTFGASTVDFGIGTDFKIKVDPRTAGGATSLSGTITSAVITASNKTWTFPNTSGNVLIGDGTNLLSATGDTVILAGNGGANSLVMRKDLGLSVASCSNLWNCEAAGFGGNFILGGEEGTQGADTGSGVGAIGFFSKPYLSLTSIVPAVGGGGNTCTYYLLAHTYAGSLRDNGGSYAPITSASLSSADCPAPAGFGGNNVTLTFDHMTRASNGVNFSIVRIDNAAPNTCKELVFTGDGDPTYVGTGVTYVDAGSVNFTWTCRSTDLDSAQVAFDGQYFPNEPGFVMMAPAAAFGLEIGTWDAPVRRMTASSIVWAPVTGDTKPTCNQGHRGQTWLTSGATGVADDFEVCVKTEGDTWVWANIGAVGGIPLVSTTANSVDGASSVWANTGSLIFEGSTANGFETTVNVLDPTEDRTISFPDSPGIVEVRSQAATSGLPSNIYAMMINGGYALDGTLTATPASKVTITLADPEADSAPTQTIQVCGYEDATNKALYVRSCETIAAIEGAVDSVNSYVEVEYIKGSAKGGDDADDTIAAEFKTGPVSIRSATAIADSAKTDITPSAAINGSSIALYCVDVAGCDFQPGDPGSAADGKTLILMAKAGTTNIVVKDDDTLVELDTDADATLDAKDTLMLIWNDSESKWLQVGKQVVN